MSDFTGQTDHSCKKQNLYSRRKRHDCSNARQLHAEEPACGEM